MIVNITSISVKVTRMNVKITRTVPKSHAWCENHSCECSIQCRIKLLGSPGLLIEKNGRILSKVFYKVLNRHFDMCSKNRSCLIHALKQIFIHFLKKLDMKKILSSWKLKMVAESKMAAKTFFFLFKISKIIFLQNRNEHSVSHSLT
jgi:hypothetical protein